MKNVVLMLISGLIIHSCSISPLPVKNVEPVDVPSEDPPVLEKELKLGRKLILWSTYYFTPILKSSKFASDCLQGSDGKCVSPKISHAQRCFCQMQGSCVIDDGVYGYFSYDTANKNRANKDCNKYGNAYKNSHYVKFRLNTTTKFGRGSFSNELEPYISIACPKLYPNLTRIFIPSAKGVRLPSGSIHSGVFRCDDRGGAITGIHIDTFIGLVDMRENFKMNDWGRAWRSNPFSHVKSKSSGTFDAYLVVE